MSDPRQADRERGPWHSAVPASRRELLPHDEALKRIEQGLSPCDDELPLAQAVREKEHMQKTAAAFKDRKRP